MNPFNQIIVLGAIAEETKGNDGTAHTDPFSHPGCPSGEAHTYTISC
jgi:hypothetical protein